MLFLLLTTAYAATYNRNMPQEGYTMCLEVEVADSCVGDSLTTVLSPFSIVEGSCQQTEACPSWVSTNSDVSINLLTSMTQAICSITPSLKCSGTVPTTPGSVDLSGCDLQSNINTCVTCTDVPTQCADFETGGCASCLTDCAKGIYAELNSLNCENLITMPDLSTCDGANLECIPDDCDRFLCASYEQYGCASCVVDCVTTAVDQQFSCNFADAITEWTGDNGFTFQSDCDVTCMSDAKCAIPEDCNDYAAKVSSGGCANCLADCAREAVADSIDGCNAVRRTWRDMDLTTCNEADPTALLSCITDSCEMPKTCDDYRNKVSSGGCAACLDDCARKVVAQTIEGCDAIVNQGNNNGAGSLSLAMVFVGSILYLL